MILDRIKSLLAPKVSIDAKLAGISLFLGKTLDNFDQRVKTAENQQLLHGKDGIDGKDGKDGKNGKDGRDGKDGRAGALQSSLLVGGCDIGTGMFGHLRHSNSGQDRLGRSKP